MRCAREENGLFNIPLAIPLIRSTQIEKGRHEFSKSAVTWTSVLFSRWIVFFLIWFVDFLLLISFILRFALNSFVRWLLVFAIFSSENVVYYLYEEITIECLDILLKHTARICVRKVRCVLCAHTHIHGRAQVSLSANAYVLKYHTQTQTQTFLLHQRLDRNAKRRSAM